MSVLSNHLKFAVKLMKMLSLQELLLIWMICFFGGNAFSQDNEATAPDNHGILESTSTGVFYVPMDTLDALEKATREYEEMRLSHFQNPAKALAEVDQLQQLADDFEKWSKKANVEKVHVEPFHVYSQRETQAFPLSEAGQIVITADNVTIRGWKGKQIKCVTEKFILGKKGDKEPKESEFQDLTVFHELRVADDLIGKVDSQPHLAVYRPLQGHEVNTLNIVGLASKQGNVHQSAKTSSKGGHGNLSGYWRRSAKVTIYVPKCKHVVVRGCMVAVDIKSVDADMILTTHGSHDRSYGVDFNVTDLNGDLTSVGVPLRGISNVKGAVDIDQIIEVTNTATNHQGGFRNSYSPPPDPITIRDIAGDLTGKFVRANLDLANIKGSIDILNEYGNTRLAINESLLEASHRVVTHSGVILGILPKDLELTIPLVAVTQSGSVQTNLRQDTFRNKSFSTEGRSWYGFFSPSLRMFSAFSRPSAAWKNEQRGNGLDLISNSGIVSVVETEK